MFRCGDCGKECATAQALGSHRRYRHPAGDLEVAASNRDELEVTLAELDRLGRFETIDAAVVQTLRSLAAAVDMWPKEAQLWRQYREALREVLNADGDADDDLAGALRAIQGAAAVGDAPQN